MKNYKDVWKALANSKSNSALHHAQYCLIKAAKAKSNARDKIAEALLRRAFTPVTNESELKNGREPWDTMTRMVGILHFSGNRANLLGVPWEEILTDEEFNVYKSLIRLLLNEPFAQTEQDWLYIFVRQDLSPEYQAVQASHATFKAGVNFSESNPDETYFCLVGVSDLDELNKVCDLLDAKGACYTRFVEPDIGNELTAVATRPMKAHKRRFLRHYPRLIFV